MNDWLRQNPSPQRIQLSILLVLLLWTLSPPSATQAEDLIDVIPALYGGDGFQTSQLSAGNRPNDFGIAVFNSFNRLTNGIGAQTGQFAVNSTVAAYRFDVERGIPVEVIKSLGPLFAERADTIGKGRFDFQVVWSHANYQKFNGESLSSLSARVSPTVPPGLPPNAPGFNEQLQVNLDVEVITNFVGFFGTYGLTDKWDVNLLIPLINNQISADSRATILDPNGIPCTQGGNCSGTYVIDGTQGPLSGDPPTDSSSGEKTGIGDILLRTKYTLLEHHEVWPDLGIRGGISFPTGKEDNFMGVGDFIFQGLGIASKYYSSPIGIIGPHVNAGAVFVNNQSGQSFFRYIGGFDYAPVPIVAFSLDLIGRREFNDKDDIGKHIVDLAPGIKVAPYPNTLIQAAVQLPMNKNEGLRPDAVWTVGVGATF